MTCIFCDADNQAISIEHIVSESFGNHNYVMKKGAVCDACNQKFSGFEQKALGATVFVMERARLGVPSKKGKSAKGKIGGLGIEGHEDFLPNRITVQGLTEENFTEFDPATLTGKLYVPSFHKSEVATGRLLLKIGLESLFTSQNKIFNQYDFSDLKGYLTDKSNDDWPFLTTQIEIGTFKSIPTFQHKYDLNKKRIGLKFQAVDADNLIFKFQYGAIHMLINLKNRNLSWCKDYLITDSVACLYPEHFRKGIKVKTESVKIEALPEDQAK